jgi:protein ImuB
VLRHQCKSQPLALLDGPKSLLKVIACNQAARMAGVAIGMTKLQAETCVDVALQKRVAEDESSAQAVLLDCAYSFSPRIEATKPGTVILDLTGTERLLGDAKTLGPAILSRAAEFGFEVNIAIAANPDAALCAARGFPGITIIAPGEEAMRLGSLPIDVLEPLPEIFDTLESWGIRTFKELGLLPSIPLTERLGQYGLHLQRLAQGTAERELIPAKPQASFLESTELEEPVDLLEPLEFVLNRQLEGLMARLKAKSLAADRVEVELTLEIHSDHDVRALTAHASSVAQHQRTIKLPVPTQDAKVLLKLIRLDLAAHPPHAPVKKVKLEATPARIRVTQMGLFQPLAPEPALLAISLARLKAVVGEQDSTGRSRVGFPGMVDSHRPDSFAVFPSSTKHLDTVPSSESRLALRMFRPALPARVEVSAEGAPVWIGFQRTKAGVIHASGPWRGGGEWWDAAGEWFRDEWDLRVKIDGADALYRIYRDFRSRQWFVEGMYD